MSGIWIGGRQYLLKLAPSEHQSEFFGFYGVTVKLSVLGCALFPLLMNNVGKRAPLIMLLLFVLTGSIMVILNGDRKKVEVQR